MNRDDLHVATDAVSGLTGRAAFPYRTARRRRAAAPPAQRAAVHELAAIYHGNSRRSGRSCERTIVTVQGASTATFVATVRSTPRIGNPGGGPPITI